MIKCIQNLIKSIQDVIECIQDPIKFIQDPIKMYLGSKQMFLKDPAYHNYNSFNFGPIFLFRVLDYSKLKSKAGLSGRFGRLGWRPICEV